MDTIGIIGVGLLGSAIAARLTAAGYGVLGYDLLPERRVGAGSAQEVARACRTIGGRKARRFSTFAIGAWCR